MDTLLYEKETSPKEKRLNNMLGKTYAENINSGKNKGLVKKLIKDIGEDAFGYFKSIPFIFDLKVLYFSPKRHYFYHPSEFSNLDAIINLRKINVIKDREDFINNIFQLLPVGGYFIGSYKDYRYDLLNKRSILGSRYAFRFFYRLNNKMLAVPGVRNLFYSINSDYSESLTMKDIRRFFQKNGFSIVNVQRIDELTYFLLIKTQHDSSKQQWYKSIFKKKNTMIIEL